MNKIENLAVTVDQLDWNDLSYRFTFAPLLAPLINSIKHIGIQNPPILEKISDHRYRIVTGFKRIMALKQLGRNRLVATVYDSPDDEPKLELFLLNLYENLGTRSLNDIEKSLALHKLIVVFHMPEEKVVTEFLPLLGLGSNQLVLNRYLKLVNLEDDIKVAVATGFLSIDIATGLLKRSATERQAIFHVFMQLKPGKNRQKEFFRLLQELSGIEDRSIDNILASVEIQQLLASNKLSLPEKNEQLSKW